MEYKRGSVSMHLYKKIAYLAVLGGLIFASSISPAMANSKYAAIVIHADTGDILFDKYSTQKRYPASLTKMMTLYLLFEELEAGRLTMSTKMKVSKYAASQPASKLGLKAGSTITVEKAIEALIIKSANDVAVVVAEKIGGSEAKFARKMTQKAWQMNMRSTQFRNASGLHNKKQYTTARDLAVLSQRVVQDFPQYWSYFQKSSFVYKGKTYKSHNKLVGNFDGADGLKTGYTRLSGYNLATTIKRGDDRLIGIVLGGRSGATRDAHMKKILNQAQAKIILNPHLVDASHWARPAPRLKPTTLAELGGVWPPHSYQTDNSLTLASNSSDALNTPYDLENNPLALVAGAPGMGSSSALKRTLANEAGSIQWTTEGSLPQEDDLGNLISVADAETLNQHSLYASMATPIISEGDIDTDIIPSDQAWSIQIGAFRDRSYAEMKMQDAEVFIAPVISHVNKELIETSSQGLPLYRARFNRLTEHEAEAACSAIISSGGECFTLRDLDIN